MDNNFKNPYEILQIHNNAEKEVIDAAYRSLARKYHPDINPSNESFERMREINWAYEILGNNENRKRWDEIHHWNSFSGEYSENRPSSNATAKPPEQTNDSYTIPEEQNKQSYSNNQRGRINSKVIIVLLMIIIGVLLLSKIPTKNFENLPNNQQAVQTQSIILEDNSAPSTIEAIPQKTSSPIEFQPGSVISYDSFSTNSSDWFEGSDNTSYMGINDHKYEMIIKAPNKFYWSTNKTPVNNSSIKVTIKITKPTINGQYGIGCRIFNNEGYYFLISEDGYYSIQKMKGIEWIPLVDWKYSKELSRLSNSKLSASCIENQLSFEINGLIQAIAYDDEFSKGNVAVVAGAGTIGDFAVAYDDIIVEIQGPNQVIIPTITFEPTQEICCWKRGGYGSKACYPNPEYQECQLFNATQDLKYFILTRYPEDSE